jgi:signal transduction histidine kinase
VRLRTSSLRWRLVQSLILLQLVVSIVVLSGFLVLLWVRNRGDETGEQAIATIRDALVRGPDGHLALGSTRDIERMQTPAGGLWFVAVDADGSVLPYGEVPPRYLQMALQLEGVSRLLIDPLADSSRPEARFERVLTRAGPVAILAKAGGTIYGAAAWRSPLLILGWVISPMALVTCLGVIIAIPFVVKRGLRQVVAAARHAERVDLHKLDSSIPQTNVVDEIRPLVDAVNMAFERLRKDFERQERFLADAAHELRTPITTLHMRIERLPNDELKAKLVQSSARLSTMAAQLLDLQRLERSTTQHAPVELKALCERVTADIAPIAVMNRCTLSIEASSAQWVTGDAPSLERALTNLIQNAIDHGGAGGSIVVRLWSPAGFEVHDSGPGIPEAERERIVQPFHRLVPRGSGAGLGLHLVAEVARLHGGRLTIGSSDLGGARMRLELSEP